MKTMRGKTCHESWGTIYCGEVYGQKTFVFMWDDCIIATDLGSGDDCAWFVNKLNNKYLSEMAIYYTEYC